MSDQLPWIERTWQFDSPVGYYPDVLARLRGTPARIEDAIIGLTQDALTGTDREGAWSVQENIGHLLDLESLFAGRLDDFLAGKQTLRGADMTNSTTREANHNKIAICEITASFRTARGLFMDRLNALSQTDFARQAQHPRLNIPMRVVDMCQFQADHDDYHLARIHELSTFFRLANIG